MTSRKFLIADDDPDFRELMQDIIHNVFSGDEITILQAGNGVEAIEQFEQSVDSGATVDIVITDFVMPEKTGSQVIEFIMQKHPVPIVVVSAFPEARHRDFLREGAIYFLKKPFDIASAKNALNAAVALKILPADIQIAREALERLKSLDI